MVISAGWYKETKIQTTIQATILVVMGTICGCFWGITGILVGAILSNIYRDIDLAVFIPKYLLHINPLRTILRILFVLNIAVLLYMPFYFYPINVKNIFEWCLYALIMLFYASIVTFIAAFIFENQTLKEIIKRIHGAINEK